jgi:hypothetical protein
MEPAQSRTQGVSKSEAGSVRVVQQKYNLDWTLISEILTGLNSLTLSWNSKKGWESVYGASEMEKTSCLMLNILKQQIHLCSL